MNGLIFTYLLTYGGAIVSLFNPFNGLLIYICFAIIKPPALWPWCVPVGNYSRVIGIAFLVGWAINGFGDRSLGKARPIVICLLGYFTWVVLSTLLSPNPALGTPFIEYMVKIILPFVAGITLIHTWKQLSQLFYVVLVSCAFIAYEANLTYIHGFDFSRERWFNLDNNSVSILMIASFGLALVKGLEEEVLWRRFAYLGIAAAMAHVPMFSMSRGGMMGALIAASVAIVIVPKTRRTWSMIGVGVVLGVLLAGPSVVDEFKTSLAEKGQRDRSAQSRVDLWRDCTTAMLMHPVFGVGQEHWGIVAHEKFDWPKGKEAHSLWFQTAAELGIPGVGFLFGFYFLTCYLLWRTSRSALEPSLPTLFRMITVSLVGFAVSGSFVTVEGFELPYYVVLIGASAIKLAHRELAAMNEDPISIDQWSASGQHYASHYA